MKDIDNSIKKFSDENLLKKYKRFELPPDIQAWCNSETDFEINCDQLPRDEGMKDIE